MELTSGTTACHPQLKVSSKVKTYVLDTNVLLHDPQSIFKFEDNNLAIPVEVLEELDAIKSEQSTERGRNARRVHRLLQELLPDSRSMLEGVRLATGGTRSVITRISEGSKIVLIGDPAQIDNPYVDSRSNGLVYAHNRMKGQAPAAHVTLTKGASSKLAELAADLL